ncbi:hypothetical protein GCM10009836_19150 [Pseudonocardia ailaonensis]|uniref:Cupin n=1 Tax=Pseudonocardia ailaonensis TaxID=367279 RepID=A0ABN2MY88_9PSEU
MRLLVTGAGADGLSFLESVRDIDTTGTDALWESAQWPPGALPAAAAAFYDNSPPPGVLQWKVATFPPDHDIPPHFTASIDLDCVVAGAVTLGLTDGAHALGVGDCVVVRGVGHRWTTGPEGVTMLIVRVGTAP